MEQGNGLPLTPTLRKHVAGLRTSYGNQAVLRMLNSLSRMQSPMPAPTAIGVLQRKCTCGGTPGPAGECAACREKRKQPLRRMGQGTVPVSCVPPIVHDVLRSPGQPLELTTRAFFEPRFGYDFGRVRVHTGVKAAKSARTVNAMAYTAGCDIAFGAGQYAPTTTTGLRLLAHELTHVVQQDGVPGVMPTNLDSGNSTDALEVEAESFEKEMMADVPSLSPPVRRRASSIGALYRAPDDCPPDLVEEPEHPGTCPDVQRESAELDRFGALGPSVETISPVECFLLRNLKSGSSDFGSPPELFEIADELNFDPSLSLHIIGFTDCVGAASLNSSLRMSRALEIRDLFVIAFKIDPLRISVDAAPLTEYVDSNQTPEGRARNRSVAMELVHAVTPPPPAPENCADLVGSCDFYLCRERKNPCGDAGYYKGYGHKYCDRFSKVTRPKMSPVGQDWLDCTLNCLQQHISGNVPENTPCDQVRTSAFSSHAGCYVKCGVCLLPPNDMTRLENTIDPEDLDLSQVLETLLRCFTLPPAPADAAFQLECVMRMGGCVQTRSGGVPTDEDIRDYNEQCRRDIGYSGPDVVPKGEDCQRAFGGGEE
jgi:hypothetical protein